MPYIYRCLKQLVGGCSNLNGEKLSTHGTRDVNCSNRFCFCFEKLNCGVSAELLEPSEEKELNLIDRYLFSFYWHFNIFKKKSIIGKNNDRARIF